MRADCLVRQNRLIVESSGCGVGSRIEGLGFRGHRSVDGGDIRTDCLVRQNRCAVVHLGKNNHFTLQHLRTTTLHNLRTTALQKCAVGPRRARV